MTLSYCIFFQFSLLSKTLVVHEIPRSKGAWGSMSTNTIYFGENEKTLGFTTLVAKLIKGRISCLYTVQPPTTTVHALRVLLWPGLWSAWRGGSARVHSLACVLRALGAPLTPPNWPVFNLPSLEALLGGPASKNTLVETKKVEFMIK